MSPPISVVVPTRDRPASLHRCLAAIRRDAGDAAELLVADDGSADAGAVVRAAGEHGATLVRLEASGPAAARNRGAALADGAVILFTDDDCEPHRGWAERLANAARRGGVGAGRTVVPRGSGAPVLASQLIIDHLMLDGLDAPTRRLAFAPSCNLAVTREALARLPFDERFGLAAGEDREWSARAVREGLAPTYEPEAVVTHRLRPGLAPFLARQVRYGRGAEQLRSRGSSLATARSRAALVRRGFSAGPAVGALTMVGQAATAVGALSERARAT